MGWLSRFWHIAGGTCPACGENLVPAQVAEVRGVADTVTVTLANLPYRACPNGHGERHYPSRTFPLQLVRALLGGQQYPGTVTDQQGQLSCIHCRRPLGNPPVTGTPVAGDVTLSGVPSFHLTIAGSTVTCPYCKTDQVVIGSGEHPVSRALQAAFDEAQLRP